MSDRIVFFFIKINTLLMCVCALFSCKSTPDTVKLLWGDTALYSDFMFCKQEPIHLKKQLNLSFNDYAIKNASPVKLQIVELDENGKNRLSYKGITIYQDGLLCENNIISLLPKSESIVLDFVITNQCSDGYHIFNLKIIDNGNLDRIDNTNIFRNQIIETGWTINKSTKWNPLKLILYVIIAILCSILFLWILFSSRIFPRMKLKRVVVIYPNGEISTIKTYNIHKVYFSSKYRKKQFVLLKFLYGKRIYKKNEIWDSSQSNYFSRMNKRTIALHTSRDFYPNIVQLSKKRLEAEVIKKSTNEKIIFKLKK